MNPKGQIDAYIKSASEPLRPVLSHIRGLIHHSVPEIEEALKWNAPSFEINGKILCSTMAFKQHVNLIFAQGKLLKDPKHILEPMGAKSSMAGLKNIQTLSDLPENSILESFIREMALLCKK